MTREQARKFAEELVSRMTVEERAAPGTVQYEMGRTGRAVDVRRKTAAKITRCALVDGQGVGVDIDFPAGAASRIINLLRFRVGCSRIVQVDHDPQPSLTVKFI